MAIHKAFTDSSGITVAYHRIQAMRLTFSYDAAYCEVLLAQYTAEQYREHEKTTPNSDAINVIERKNIIIEITPEEADRGLSRAAVYEKIMALPEWEGSTAV